MKNNCRMGPWVTLCGYWVILVSDIKLLVTQPKIIVYSILNFIYYVWEQYVRAAHTCY